MQKRFTKAGIFLHPAADALANDRQRCAKRHGRRGHNAAPAAGHPQHQRPGRSELMISWTEPMIQTLAKPTSNSQLCIELTTVQEILDEILCWPHVDPVVNKSVSAGHLQVPLVLVCRWRCKAWRRQKAASWRRSPPTCCAPRGQPASRPCSAAPRCTAVVCAIKGDPCVAPHSPDTNGPGWRASVIPAGSQRTVAGAGSTVGG